MDVNTARFKEIGNRSNDTLTKSGRLVWVGVLVNCQLQSFLQVSYFVSQH